MTPPADIQALTGAISILRCLHAERRGEPAPDHADADMARAFDRIGLLKAGIVRAQLNDVLDALEGVAPLPLDESETFDDRQAYEFHLAAQRDKRLVWTIVIAVGIAAGAAALMILGGRIAPP